MPAKSLMLGELAERELLLPSLLNEALAANDRAKYRLTLLQTAYARGRNPGGVAPTLRRERLAAQVDEPALDDVVAQARDAGDGRVAIPGLPTLVGHLLDDVRTMFAPLRAARVPDVESLAGRLGALDRLPADELLDGAALDRLASGRRDDGDSVHLLVMDLHRQLNALQGALATEAVAGARAYGLDEPGRGAVAAFMAGVNRTAPLKFDHPGLGTTATLAGTRLVIENDIGMTDVHLLVVHVDGLAVTVTCSDLHAARLAFFREQLEPFPIAWTVSAPREAGFETREGAYLLATGTFEAADAAALHRFLEHLGSRLVFLIDWNRARKRLRQFVGKREAIALLAWAAREEVGHMGFLRLGGEQAVYEALETTRVPLRAGERLDELLGRERAVAFLRFVLRAASEGLRRGRSPYLVRDEVRAELTQYLRSAEQGALAVAVDHAGLVVELAAGLRDALEADAEPAAIRRAAERARRWEHRADELVNQARVLARRWPSADALRRQLQSADDVADALEDASFLLTLPVRLSPGPLDGLRTLATLVCQGSEAWLKALECARALQQGRDRDDLEDFLAAIDEVLRTEHAADDANRHAKAVNLADARDFRELALAGDLARRLEAAADGLMQVALVLRGQVLGEAA